MPGRPDHPDFWRLSELVLQLDGQATEAGMQLDEMVAGVIDPASLGYMAVMRAMKLVGAETRGQLAAKQREVARFATLYHEAFILGVRFEAKRSPDDH